MEIQFCSDLHLEFKQNSQFFQDNPIGPSAEILVLAGDITYLRKDFYADPFFDYISKNWKSVYWLPGNHEYYCGIEMRSYHFTEPFAIRKNVFIVDNCSIEIDGFWLIFTTLWSELDKKHEKFIEKHVSDFECIICDGKKLDAKSFNALFHTSVDYLKKALKTYKDDKKIIITHHLPSPGCNHHRFAGSILNSAFVAKLDGLIEKSNALAWIYGHSHMNMPDFTIGKTLMITNQFGYMQYNEHKTFNPVKKFQA
jgi:Icc-related predicted phosphoesterase